MHPKRGPEEGTGSGSSGSTTPPPPADQQQPSQAQPQTPPQQQQGPTTPPEGSQTPPPGFVPADQLRAVVAERDRLAAEARQREEDEAKAKGEWEGVAQKREQERDEWKNRFITTARRSAFVAAIANDVNDAEAAYKLALADGFLNDVKVGDDGNADERAIADAKKSTLDRYKFLKRGAGSFGGDRSGQQPESTGFDPSKADSRTLLREGIRQAGTSGSGR